MTSTVEGLIAGSDERKLPSDVDCGLEQKEALEQFMQNLEGAPDDVLESMFEERRIDHAVHSLLVDMTRGVIEGQALPDFVVSHELRVKYSEHLSIYGVGLILKSSDKAAQLELYGTLRARGLVTRAEFQILEEELRRRRQVSLVVPQSFDGVFTGGPDGGPGTEDHPDS